MPQETVYSLCCLDLKIEWLHLYRCRFDLPQMIHHLPKKWTSLKNCWLWENRSWEGSSDDEMVGMDGPLCQLRASQIAATI